MHASYQIIIQVLQLAYTTQACISNLKTYAMQASTWICIYQMQWNKFMSLLPLLVCFSCPRILIHLFSSMLLPLCPCPCPISLPCTISILRLSYLYTISPPLSSISIKGELLINAKVYVWGRWLRLESCIFYGHLHDCWNDTICIYHL